MLIEMITSHYTTAFLANNLLVSSHICYSFFLVYITSFQWKLQYETEKTKQTTSIYILFNSLLELLKWGRVT